jgi:hypothetical protein
VNASIPPAGEAATELLTAGAELSELFSEVVRRRGGITLVQYRTLAALGDAAVREPWELAPGSAGQFTAHDVRARPARAAGAR